MESQHHLQIAIKLDPNDFEAYMYLGDVLNNLKQFLMAIESYKKAVPLAWGPAAAKVLESIADTYGNLKQHNNASRYYEDALRASGDNIPARLHVGRLFNQLNTANWQYHELHLRDTVKAVADGLQSGEPSDLSPYQAMFLSQSNALSLGVSRSWAKGFSSGRGSAHCEGEQCAAVGTADRAVEARRKIRVGYISRRFEDYPGTQMMLRLFQVHNRSRIDVFCYAHGPDDKSTYRAFIEEQCDRFMDISSLADSDAFQVLSRDQLDILVDYDGIHDFNNIKVLLGQPARTQVTWLGFAGTTGFRPGEGIDFVMADSFIVPPESARSAFSEKLVYIPGGYQPQDEFQGASVEEADDREASGRVFELSNVWFLQKTEVRSDLIRRYVEHAEPTSDEKHLLEAVWLICFNRIEKVSPEVFEDWMHILQRTQNTVLLLMAQTKDVQRRLQDYSSVLGVQASKRILFLKHMPRWDYMNALAVSDLFLDTANYGAHTTASDGMFGSLPIITRPGVTFSSRVAGSLNIAVQSSFLNTDSRRDYVDAAVEIATKPGLLLGLHKIIKDSLGVNIFNSTQMSDRLERVYLNLMDIYPLQYNLFSPVQSI